MPKNKVSNPITDQEIAFARLVLSGTMTDRRAAEAVGLNPGTAAYTKSKPRVRAYILEHRAAVQQQRAEQDTEELRRGNLSRDQVLARLWEIAKMDPERTRGSMSAQVKSLSMIIAIEGLIPDRLSDRRAVAAQDKPAPPPVNVEPPFYVAAWRRAQQDEENVDPQPPPPQQATDPAFVPDPASPENPPPPVSNPTPNLCESTVASTIELSSRPERSVVEGPAVPGPLNPPQETSAPPPSRDSWVPDTRAPFQIIKNRFGRRR